MVVSKINFFSLSIYLARLAAPCILLAELYLHVFVIAPVVFGVGPSYFIYLSVLAFIVMNVIGNISSFILTDTSVMMDTCMDPELNVKLCTLCDRNVPPRFVFVSGQWTCNNSIPRKYIQLGIDL